MKKNRYNNYANKNNSNNYAGRNNAPKANSRKNVLNQAGVDAEQYLSMRIDKEFIPDGAEIVIQVRD